MTKISYGFSRGSTSDNHSCEIFCLQLTPSDEGGMWQFTHRGRL